MLFVSGTEEKPKMTLNGKDVTAALMASTQDGTDGRLRPLPNYNGASHLIRATS